MRSTLRRGGGALLGLALISGLGLSSASATGAPGIITGTVSECPPGPIIYSPGKPAPSPTPVTVTLRRDGQAVARRSVHFGTVTKWSGTYSFHVVPGRYEVVTSYANDGPRWVDLPAGGRRTVRYAPFACPLALRAAPASATSGPLSTTR